MTRINVGVNPRELTDKHLLAEHREMKRIPNAIRTGKAIIKDIPSTFRLGSGHVKFFYTRLKYLLDRYRNVYNECVNRGFSVTNYSNAWEDIPDDLMGDYTPTESDRKIVLQRINERLLNNKK